MLNDWELLHWVMPELWGWQTIPYNPEALTSKAWLEELRQGRYRGRPRTADRPYGTGDQAGHWAEFEQRSGHHAHRQRGVELERVTVTAAHGAAGRRHHPLRPGRRRPAPRHPHPSDAGGPGVPRSQLLFP